MKTTPKTLAIDYGTQRIGLALSQATLAEPWQIIVNSQQKQVIQQLKKLCQGQAVKQLVVGLSEKEMETKTREFAQELKAATNLPLFFADETLSSVQVKTKMHQAQLKKTKRQGPIDHYAAAQILQNWLDQQA